MNLHILSVEEVSKKRPDGNRQAAFYGLDFEEIASMGGICMKIVTVRAKGILRPILRRIFKIRKT